MSDLAQAYVLESVHPFSLVFDISEELFISINWLILSIFCIKKFPKSSAKSTGAISFGNNTSDGSHSSDLVVQNKFCWFELFPAMRLVWYSQRAPFITNVVWFHAPLKAQKSWWDFVLRHFLSAFCLVLIAHLISLLNHGKRCLQTTTFSFVGTCLSRRDVSVEL